MNLLSYNKSSRVVSPSLPTSLKLRRLQKTSED